PLVAGREFLASDEPDRPGAAVVDREFARRFLGGNALGALVDCGVGVWTWGEGVPRRFEVVGVVADVRSPAPGQTAQPTLYLPLTQVPQREIKLLVRSESDAGAIAGAVRARIRALDPGVPIAALRTLADERARAVAQPRFNLELM